MKFANKYLLVLICIVFFSFLLRFWQIGNVPLSLDWDEVALGYNAYSIINTGKDEYGEFLPIILRSFDDYKPALYMYLTIPAVLVFGLTDVAVRIPSVIIGTLTVLATYFIVLELFKPNNQQKKYIIVLGLLSALFLAISPWHLQFSRIAFEASIGMAFTVFFVLFFLKGLNTPQYLILSAIFMGMNLYSYQSEKILTPLTAMLLLIIYRKELFAIKRTFLVSAFTIGLIISLPISIFTLTNKEALTRAQGVSIFNNKTSLLQNEIKKLERDVATNNTIGILFDNRRIVYFKNIASNYLSHFDLNWLFIRGDFENNRHHAPNMGLLYLFELPFLLIGFYVLIFGTYFFNIPLKTKLLLYLWILITPLPASITTGVPHAVRTIHFLPIFQIITALGVLQSIIFVRKYVGNTILRYTVFSGLVAVFTFNFIYFLNQYFVQLNYYYAKDWQYGYKEAVSYLNSVHTKYDKVIVSNNVPMDQSYMFFLFYLKYDPAKYLDEGGTKSGRFDSGVNSFSNFEFREFSYDKEPHNSLMVGSLSDFDKVYRIIFVVPYPDKTTAVQVVEK